MSAVTVRLTFCSKIQLAHIIVTHIYTCIGIIFCIQIKIRNIPLVAYFFYTLIIRFKITFGVICKRIMCNNKPYFRVRKIISNFKNIFSIPPVIVFSSKSPLKPSVISPSSEWPQKSFKPPSAMIYS